MYENIDKNLYTPMIRQYLTIKENYPDTLVFFRVGDFYELFFNDAIVASRELEIILTKKDVGVQNEPVPMAGVPHHAVTTYIERLSEKGYRIAIVDQMEDANNKKIVKREVTKIITPGTNIDEHYLNEKNNNFLASIDKLEDGFAFSYVDLSTGDSYITKLPKYFDALYNEINKLSIKEIVVNSSIPKIVREYLTNVLHILISNAETTVLDSYLTVLFEQLDNSLKPCVEQILSYLINTQKRTLMHLKPFKYYDINEFLKLDFNTVRNLELISSIRNNDSNKSLFGILDHCSTAMGSRFLKRSIMFPFTNINNINKRLDIVEQLMKNYLLLPDLKTSLQEIYDLERIVGRISYGSLSPKDLLQLNRSLSELPNIKKTLKKMKGSSLQNFNDQIKIYDEITSLISSSIKEDAPYLLRDGGFIKEGYSKELDEVKNINSSNKAFLANLELNEKEKTGIKNLKVGYNRVFGYYIEITKPNIHLVKDEFGYIRKQTTANSERYITEELKEREALILRSEERALQIEMELFEEIRNVCKKFCHEIQMTALIISEIDMLTSFANVARKNNYVRPVFSQYGEVDIKDGRHPVIESNRDKIFISNDLKMDNTDYVMLITGPNMSGKSTFMRQTALISIMAQIGCFVSATSATLPLYDQIFTRIGASDDITSGESTFMVEMNEVNYALQNATYKSLILFDEVGRGTATYDGMALAQGIIEYLHNNTCCKTLFSTHYHELTNLDQSLPHLKNLHVDAKEENGDIIFMHKVLPGSTDKSYGINVAQLAKIPEEVIFRATDILEKLLINNTIDASLLSIDNYQKPTIIDKRDPKETFVIEKILKADVENLKPIEALLLLSELKEKLGE
ncbi:MAG: DNA mismatch repair protein MutS [Bacilli bacterium]|nr:DNA mismatch repair protein MutS [Bacilli bacterium]